MLPPEIWHRIASFYIADGLHHKHALNFATISETHRYALVAASSHKLILSQHIGHADVLAPVFVPDIRELHICRHTYYHSFALVRAPSLVRVTVPGLPICLIDVARTPSIRSLTVTDLLPSYFPLLLDVLASMPLTEFRLVCQGLENTCLLTTALTSDAAYASLASSCPTVSVLDIQCHCYPDPSIWPLYAAFPKLKELTVYFPLEDAALPFLRSLETVHIRTDTSAAVRFARMIGCPVKSLSIGKNYLHDSDLAALLQCPDLSHLNIRLYPGAEHSLHNRHTSLRALELEWPTVNLVTGHAQNLHIPEPGSILRLAKTAPKLSKLHLRNVHVQTLELVAILKLLGPNMRSFCVTVDAPKEPFDVRLVVLMQTVATYTRELREFLVNRVPRGSRTVSSIGLGPIARMRSTLDLLNRRAPFLDTTDLSEYIESYWDVLESLMQTYSTWQYMQRITRGPWSANSEILVFP